MQKPVDPAVGFLHRDRPGRPGLALDLMEELRPVLADGLALSLINRRQIGPSDFTSAETGAVTLTDEARRTVIAAWRERRKDRIHPFLHLGSGPDATLTPGGTRRLRQGAKACRDFGQRVQFSVFEIEVDPAQWAFLKVRLELIIDASSDSLCCDYLGADWIRRACRLKAGDRLRRAAHRVSAAGAAMRTGSMTRNPAGFALPPSRCSTTHLCQPLRSPCASPP